MRAWEPKATLQGLLGTIGACYALLGRLGSSCLVSDVLSESRCVPQRSRVDLASWALASPGAEGFDHFVWLQQANPGSSKTVTDIHTYIHIYIYIHTYIYTYIYIYIYTCAYIFRCVQIFGEALVNRGPKATQA